MPMKPRKGESESDFMARCVPDLMGDGKRPKEQAVAACLTIWRDSKKKQVDAPAPDDDESHTDFMDRCIGELNDEGVDDDAAEEACQIAWEDRSAGADLVYRTFVQEDDDDATFVMSDDSEDRMGDVIAADGWTLTAFRKNPIALFGHRSDFVIGTWRDVKIEANQLKGDLKLAPEGTSDRIDEIRRLRQAGILKAVSVGFRPLEKEPLNKDADKFWGPFRFIKQELVECSLVAVPANANALAVARSLNVSTTTIDAMLAESGSKSMRTRRRGAAGESAQTSRTRKGGAMTLAQRISDLQTSIVTVEDALRAHHETMDNDNVSDADVEKTNSMNVDLAAKRKRLQAWIDSEKLLGKETDAAHDTRSRALSTTVLTQTASLGGQPIIVRSQKKDPDLLDLIVRVGTVAIRAKDWKRQVDEAREKVYGNDLDVKNACDLVLRAASAPAMTTVTGWAAELVRPRYVDLMPLLMPKSILTRLAPRGLTLDFDGAGKIIIPTRSRTPTIAGSFVGEGLPIPVRQGAFTSQTLVPKKLAVITVWTHEMEESSNPAIEGILREAIQVDTTVAIDSVLLDANPATAVRPAGLLNGVTPLGATAGGGLTALIGDIKQLINAIAVATYGNVRNPVWLINPTDLLSAALTTVANTGVFPFMAEIAAGTLANIPYIDSSTVPLKTLILIDAADFVTVGGGAPRFETSDQATLHMDDTAPLELVAPGSPGVVAAPQRSLFQTDSIALRMVLPMNWANRRPGTVAVVTSVTW